MVDSSIFDLADLLASVDDSDPDDSEADSSSVGSPQLPQALVPLQKGLPVEETEASNVAGTIVDTQVEVAQPMPATESVGVIPAEALIPEMQSGVRSEVQRIETVSCSLDSGCQPGTALSSGTPVINNAHIDAKDTLTIPGSSKNSSSDMPHVDVDVSHLGNDSNASGQPSNGSSSLVLRGLLWPSLEPLLRDANPSLISLSLAGNLLADPDTLGAAVSCLHALTDLDISCNRLRKLPTCVQLRRLRTFNASENELKCSRGLLFCTDLRNVALSRNQIRRVEQLETLQCLEELDVSYNNLGPTSLVALRPVAACLRLRVLCVDGNPFASAGVGHRAQLAALIPSLQLIDNHKMLTHHAARHSALPSRTPGARRGPTARLRSADAARKREDWASLQRHQRPVSQASSTSRPQCSSLPVRCLQRELDAALSTQSEISPDGKSDELIVAQPVYLRATKSSSLRCRSSSSVGKASHKNGCLTQRDDPLALSIHKPSIFQSDVRPASFCRPVSASRVSNGSPTPAPTTPTWFSNLPKGLKPGVTTSPTSRDNRVSTTPGTPVVKGGPDQPQFKLQSPDLGSRSALSIVTQKDTVAASQSGGPSQSRDNSETIEFSRCNLSIAMVAVPKLPASPAHAAVSKARLLEPRSGSSAQDSSPVATPFAARFERAAVAVQREVSVFEGPPFPAVRFGELFEEKRRLLDQVGVHLACRTNAKTSGSGFGPGIGLGFSSSIVSKSVSKTEIATNPFCSTADSFIDLKSLRTTLRDGITRKRALLEQLQSI